MTFKKGIQLKEIELVGLIDIVFLLLIFFLLTIVVNPGGKKEATPPIEPLDKMPEAEMKGSDIDRLVSTLIIQVEYDSTREGSPFCAYFIEKDKDQKTTLFRIAYTRAKEDTNRWADIPPNFDQLLEHHKNIASQENIPPDYMAPKVIQLVEEKVPENRENGYIEIRAAGNTEFGFINFILTECSADTINYVAFRTLCED